MKIFKKTYINLFSIFFIGIFIIFTNNCFCLAKTKNNELSNKNKTTVYNVKGVFQKGSYIVNDKSENNPKAIYYTYYRITNKDGSKYGIADDNGKLVIPCEYDCIYKNSPFIIVENNGKKGAFSNSGKNILQIEFDDISVNYGQFIVTVADKQSIYSSYGKRQLLDEYDKINSIVKGKFLLKKDNKYYLYNVEKNEVTDLPYDKVSRYLNYLLVEKNGKKGLYSYNEEKIVVPVKYDDIKSYTNDTLIVTLNGKKGLLDIKSSKFFIPLIYKDIKINQKFYLLLLKKQNNKFDLAYTYTENKKTYAAVIDIDADEISDDSLWHASYKKEKFLSIPIKKNGKYTIMLFSKERNIAGASLPYEYDEIIKIGNFYKIKKNGKFALYDIFNQKFRSDFLFDDCERLGFTSYFKVKIDGKYAILDLDKNKMSDFEYEDIRITTKFHHKYIQIKKNGKWKYINPSKIVKQGFANGLYYMGLLVASPVLVPTAGVFMFLIYTSVHESPPKYPKKIKVYSE